MDVKSNFEFTQKNSVALNKDEVRILLKAGKAIVEPLSRIRHPPMVPCDIGSAGGSWKRAVSDVWTKFGAVRVVASDMPYCGARCQDVVACSRCFQVYVYRSRRQGTSSLRFHRCPFDESTPEMESDSSIDVPQQTPPTPTKQPVPVQPPQPPPQPQPPTQKKVQPQQAPSLKPIAPKPPQPRPVSPLQPSQPPPEVCLRWNSYHSNMQATFPSLLNNEQFVDVTLACEGRSIKCHKMMLSACSSYFEELLSQNPCQHPIVLMKDLRYWEVQALVDFMYRGEVNVGQDKLPSLLAAAEALQIKGLAGPATSAHEEDSAPSLIPLSSAEDYLEESVPSPSSARRARKRRVMSTVQSPLPPTVQSQQVPLSPSRSVVGRQRLMRPSVPSNFSHEGSSNLSEPPARRPRKSDSGEFVGEIKVEPIDIEISNDSMDNIDDAFMEKTYDGSETGDGGESSGQGDDPGGTNDIVKSGNDHRTDARQDCEQMDFGNNGMASGNDQNFNFEDGTQDGGLSSVSHMTDTGYHDSLAQPSSSGITGSGSGNIADSLLGHM